MGCACALATWKAVASRSLEAGSLRLIRVAHGNPVPPKKQKNKKCKQNQTTTKYPEQFIVEIKRP